MKHPKIMDLRRFVRQVHAEGISMRRRFVVYIISAIALVLSLVIFLLNLLGILNPTRSQLVDVLDTQLSTYTDQIQHDYDKLAAHAMSFSHQIEDVVQRFLTEHNLRFDELKNNPDALTALQCQLYDTVYLHMQLAPSSGAFYILDTTVKAQSDTPLFNGIYLKYINLNSESTVNNEITLYRGSFATAKKGNLTVHSGWNNEMRTDFFNHCESEFTKGTYYILSPTVEIPDTWEHARYVYAPIRDDRGDIIGVCGFEVSDLYFQLSKKATDSKLGPLVGGLLDEAQNGYSGQFSSTRYNTLHTDTITVAKKGDATVFDFGSEKCVGKTTRVTLGGRDFTVALMMTEAQYDALILQGQLKTTGVVLFVLLVAFTYCLFVSKKYVAPLLQKINQITHSEDAGAQLKIREIDDLFAFLAERDLAHEAQLSGLQAAKQAAEEEARRTKAAYEKALEQYQLAQNQILQLSEDQKKKISLEDYDYFICNLKTLTPTESRIYELYLEGHTAHQIAEILGIQENTLKYHNKNIYGKLGVSSRKQLLRFAALKQQQDKKDTSDI